MYEITTRLTSMSGREVTATYSLDSEGNPWLGDVFVGRESMDAAWLARNIQDEILRLINEGQGPECIADDVYAESKDSLAFVRKQEA